MLKDKSDYYIKELNKIIPDLLIPARTSKTIDKQAFENFNELLSTIQNNIKNDNSIPKQIVGKQFDIYVALCTESQYCEFDSDLFIKTAEYESFLSKLFNTPL